MMVEEHHMIIGVLDLLNDSVIIDTFHAILKLANFLDTEELVTVICVNTERIILMGEECKPEMRKWL